MSKEVEHGEAVVAVEPGGGHAAGSPNVVDPSAQLSVLTWATFGVLFWLLHKTVWKPLLRSLENRETTIRTALDEAKKANAKLVETEAQCRKLAEQAELRSRETIAAAKVAAEAVRKDIERAARAEADSLLESTKAELRAAVENARRQLRKDSADLACRIAEEILRKKLDAAGDRRLADEYLEQLGK